MKPLALCWACLLEWCFIIFWWRKASWLRVNFSELIVFSTQCYTPSRHLSFNVCCMVNTLKLIALTSFLFRVLLYLTIWCFSSPLRWAFEKNWLPIYFDLLSIIMTEQLKLRCTKMHRYLSSHRYGGGDVLV